MKKSIIILSFILAISELGNVSHAFDTVPASTGNYQVSSSDEEPVVNNEEDDSNRKRRPTALLILLRNSEENENSTEEETEEAEELINHGHKTKRCKAVNPHRKARRILMPKDPQKYFSGSTESSLDDGIEGLNDEKSYFRLASMKDTKNILKSLLKSRPAQREDNDAIVETVPKLQDQDAITLGGQDFKKPGDQRPKKYVCYCIEDNCGTKKSKKTSRPYGMKKTMGPNILAKNSYSTNKENQQISGLDGSEQQVLGAPHNLHCPPGAVLVEESDCSEHSDRKHHSQKRRPVKKCPPTIMPCESEAQSIGHPTRINIPLTENRKFNRRVYKVDRKLPFVQKLQSVFEQNEADGGVPCPETETPLNGGLGVQDYYNNQINNFNPYAQVPMAPNLVHSSPYVVYPQYPQYPQYRDGLVGETQVRLQPVDEPYEGHREPPYEAKPPRRNFLDIEECINMFGPNNCVVSTTPITSVNCPETAQKYEEEHDEPSIDSHWQEEIRHMTTELYRDTEIPRKTSKWGYPTNPYDNYKLAATYFQTLEASKKAEGHDEKSLQHSGQYPQSHITTKPGQYRGSTPQYFSDQAINTEIRPSYNLLRITTPSNRVVGSKQKKPADDNGDENFVDPISPLRHSDPTNIEYLIPIADLRESGTEDYYGAAPEAGPNGVRKIPSLKSVSEFRQSAGTSISSNWQGAHGVSSPQYLEYTIKPTGKDIGPSSSEDTSEEIAEYVPTTHDSELPSYGTSEFQYLTDSFHQQQDRNGDEVGNYHTTRPGERVGITKQHSVHGSPGNDEEPRESSTKSPNAVFLQLEERRANYRTTIPTENLKGKGFQGSQRITAVYPVVDSEDHTFSTTSRTQSPNNRNDENLVSPSSNLHYAVQPEQTAANVASKIAKTTTSHRPPVGMIELTPVNDYSEPGFVSSATSDSDNRYTTSYAAMKNAGYGTTTLLGVNEPGQRKFTSTSYRPLDDVEEVKTVSSWPQEIKEANNEDNLGETPSTPYHTTRLEIPDVNKYSTTEKSSHPQQSTSDERTSEKSRQKFLGSNEPTTENVVSRKKDTDYGRTPIGRSRDQYTTSYIQNLPSGKIESANEYPFDTKLSEEVTNHYSGVPSGNWDYTTQFGRKTTSSIDQQQFTDLSTQRQYVGSYHSIPDGIIPATPRSDLLNRPASNLGKMYSPTTTEGLQKSSPQPSEMSSKYNFYSIQSEGPLFVVDHRTSAQPEDQELALSTVDDNYSTEYITNNDTPAESILGETMAAETEADKPEKNREGKSRHHSKESHQLITTPSEYDDNKGVERTLGDSLQQPGTTLSFENNSDFKEEHNGYFSSNSLDDKVKEVTGPDSYFEIADLKNLNDFISVSSDGTTVTDNDQTKGINYSTVDEEVGGVNRSKTTDSPSSNNSKDYTTNHDVVVKELSQKGRTVNDKFITETQSYRKDDDDFSPTKLRTQIINEVTRQSYPSTNYKEKYSTTDYYEAVSPRHEDDIARVPNEEFENPHEASYSSTPMSAIHYYGNPSTFSDVLKSENIVRDKSPTEDDSNHYSRTNQYSQSTLETHVQNPVEDDHKSNDDDDGNAFSSTDYPEKEAFRQEELASQRNVAKNTLPAMSTLKKDMITINNKFSDIKDETQRMIPYDIIGNTPGEENSSTKNDDDGVFSSDTDSPTQQSYSTESLVKAEPTFNTDSERNTLQDVNRSNNDEDTPPSDSLTETPKFEEFTPPYDLVRDVLRAMATTGDKAESTAGLTTEKIKQQDDISKKISSSEQFTPFYDRVGDAQKDITIPEANDENTIEPIASKSELESDEFAYTNVYTSLENSRTTEYPPYPYEPPSSSPVFGNTLRSRSFVDSEGVTPTTIYEESTSSEHGLTSKNKESVGTPLRSHSIATTGHTDLLKSFPTVKSPSNNYKKYGALSSTNRIALQPHYTESETSPTNENTKEILNDDGISDEDRNYLKTAVQKVVKDLISPKSNNAFKNAPNTPETVAASNQGLLSELPVLKNLFTLREVKDMAINNIKGLIFDTNGVPRDSSLGRLKDDVIESIFNGVINDLLPGQRTTLLSSSMAVDEHQYENGHWTVVPATLASIKGNVLQKPANEISNSIQNIIGHPGIGLEGARLPAVQNIIVHAVENALRRVNDVDHSLIWDTLSKIIARAENAGKSPHEPRFTVGTLPKAPSNKTPSGSLKNMPLIPVIEHVFKDGQWSEKHTILGIKRKHFDSKLSPSIPTRARDDNELRTLTSSYKTSVNNVNELVYTTDSADYALLGESDEKEDETTMQDVVGLTDNVPVETTVETVGATPNKQNIEDKEDLEEAPIKYYSPNDRILTYIKNHQTPGGKTQTTVRTSDPDETTRYYLPPPAMGSNEFPTIDGSVEIKDATVSDNDEVSTLSTQASSLRSTENSKTSTCMDEETKNNANNVDDRKHIQSTDTTEEYIAEKNRQMTLNSRRDPEQAIRTTESPKFSSTIHHLDVTEYYDYTTEEYISKENLSTTEETTEKNDAKVVNTQLPPSQSTVNHWDEEGEGEGQSERAPTQEYIKEANSSTTDESKINSNEMQSFSTDSSRSNPFSSFASKVLEAGTYRNIDQRVHTPKVVETTVDGEDRREMTSRDESETQTIRRKFTKIPKYYDSTQEATTLTRGLVGAAKSRGGKQKLQENTKGSTNFVPAKWDPTYFGTLRSNGVNRGEDKISDLKNTDLFYVGDGVKIPLIIQRLPDGSYALSISEKICENFIKRKCPCCVPNEGDIVEERRQPNVAENAEYETASRRNSNVLASLEPTESSEYESKSKKRYVRSTSGSDVIVTSTSPVKSFIRKYNMTLNLGNDQIPDGSMKTNVKAAKEVINTRRTKRLGSSGDAKILNLFENNNQIQRDDSEEQTPIIDDNSEVISKESNTIRKSEFNYDRATNSFIHSLLHIRDVPEDKRVEIVVNALDGLINSASAKNPSPVDRQSLVESIDEDSTEDQSRWEDSSVYDLKEVENRMTGYGYQKDNPILERIRFIKENQHGRGQYKYQQNIDREARGKMNMLKTVLNWLREVFLEAKVNNKN